MLTSFVPNSSFVIWSLVSSRVKALVSKLVNVIVKVWLLASCAAVPVSLPLKARAGALAEIVVNVFASTGDLF